MRWIYISPHLDDAVLSAGGFIYEQTRNGNPVEIWTIVCGYPPPGELTLRAQLEHFQWGTGTAKETIDLRRAEDVHAASIIGAKPVHFDIPDCIYRRGPDGEELYLDIFVQPHEAESHLPDQIAQTIAPRLLPDDQIICQLGIGGHVDHIIVRQAVEQLKRPLWCGRCAIFIQSTGRTGLENCQDERIPSIHNGSRPTGLGRGGFGI